MLGVIALASLPQGFWCGSAEDVLADFDRGSGQVHVIADTLAKVPVLISVPAKDVPNVLADLLEATWSREEGKLTLRRSASQASTIERRRLEWIVEAVRDNLSTPGVPDQAWRSPELLFDKLRAVDVDAANVVPKLSLATIARQVARRILERPGLASAVRGSYSWPPAPGFRDLPEEACEPIRAFIGIVADRSRLNAWRKADGGNFDLESTPTRIVVSGLGTRTDGSFRLYAIDQGNGIVDQGFASWQLRHLDIHRIEATLPGLRSAQVIRADVFDPLAYVLPPIVRQIRFPKTEANALRAQVDRIDKLGCVRLLLEPIADALLKASSCRNVAIAFNREWVSSLLWQLYEPSLSLESVLRLGYSRTGLEAHVGEGTLYLRPVRWPTDVLPLEILKLGGLPELSTVGDLAGWASKGSGPITQLQVEAAASTQSRWFRPQAAAVWNVIDGLTQEQLLRSGKISWSIVPRVTAQKLAERLEPPSPLTLDDLRPGATLKMLDRSAGRLAFNSSSDVRLFALANDNKLNRLTAGLDAYGIVSAQAEMQVNSSKSDLESILFEPVEVGTFNLKILDKAAGTMIDGWELGRTFRSLGDPAVLSKQSRSVLDKLSSAGFRFRGH